MNMLKADGDCAYHRPLTTQEEMAGKQRKGRRRRQRTENHSAATVKVLGLKQKDPCKLKTTYTKIPLCKRTLGLFLPV